MALRMLLLQARSACCKGTRSVARVGTATGVQLPCTASRTAVQLSSGARPWTARCIATSAARGGLAEQIEKELDYERENYEPTPEVQDVPKGWQLVDEAGSSHLTLTRKYKGEQINVEIMCDEQPEDPAYEDEAGNPVEPEDEDMQMGLEFSVHVTKGDQTLVFECIGDGSQDPTISNISLEPTRLADSDSEGAYNGPEYGELDPGLHTEFDKYLQQRGITADLIEYLKALVDDKEQREYTAWLKRVKEFVSS